MFYTVESRTGAFETLPSQILPSDMGLGHLSRDFKGDHLLLRLRIIWSENQERLDVDGE